VPILNRQDIRVNEDGCVHAALHEKGSAGKGLRPPGAFSALARSACGREKCGNCALYPIVAKLNGS